MYLAPFRYKTQEKAIRAMNSTNAQLKFAAVGWCSMGQKDQKQPQPAYTHAAQFTGSPHLPRGQRALGSGCLRSLLSATQPIERRYEAKRAIVESDSTASKATGLARVIRDRAVVKITLMRVELTGTWYRGEILLIQREYGSPSSRLLKH